MDGFISIDTPYEMEGLIVTKPLIFEGNRLVLNVDTDAVGYLQVGFLDESGNPVPGFSVDDCIYINGDFLDAEVEWLENREDLEGTLGMVFEEIHDEFKNFKTTKDVSILSGKKVQLVFRMRGTKLYAMQFVQN
jgi:hypothetical protein